MAKVALLIGVSDYQISGSNQGFTDLPSAKLDVEGMKRILESPEQGGFDSVVIKIDPEYYKMNRDIEDFLSDRQKEDLVLLYFSGHGAKDKTRKLYFAAKGTEKNSEDQLVTSTAVSAQFVREKLDNCKAQRKIMILDCCFSGAIDPNAKGDDDTLEVLETSLSAVKGSIILTSSSSTEISYGDRTQMSFYTRHFVRGIETGEADRNTNGHLSIYELHNYVTDMLRIEKANMNPRIFLLQEDGFYNSPLIKVQITNPDQALRRKIKSYIDQGLANQGEFEEEIKEALIKFIQKINQSGNIQLSSEDAEAIESELLQPIKDRLKNLEIFRKRFQKKLADGTLDQTRGSLRIWQEEVLGLTDADVAYIEQEEQRCHQLKQEESAAKLKQSETKEEVLQVFFNQLTGLLVDKNLLALAAKVHAADTQETEGQPKIEVMSVERAQLFIDCNDIRTMTLSILCRFENYPECKTSVIRFLIEADIISKLKPNLSGADLIETDLSGADLNGADLRFVYLSGANLSNVNLIGANLSYANLSGANLSYANLNGADLKKAGMFSANLRYASLSDAELCGAALFEADLRGADLRGADLSGAVLDFADLREAVLRDANLREATLSYSLFGNNPGLTTADKADLKARGATFADTPTPKP